ncbi:F-box protein At2g39490-like [Diospyros lotus]|uniref:F-box protein At2g39490-like n=1 Tax=Diospyros lotus TaxID=55363 RepID=UPI00225440FD|nr:F-box protein At2g39490-like [Diospyros lotus]
MEEESFASVSSLPREILQRIVSMMPLIEAVRTRVLSSSWKSLWTPFQVGMDFDSDQIVCNEAREKVSQILAVLLKQPCDNPELWKFSLSRIGSGEEDVIFLATKGAGNELHLDFHGEMQISSNFNWVLEQRPNRPTSCGALVEMGWYSSLKKLHLRSVNQLAKDLVSSLLLSCQFLESLKVEKSSGLESLNVKANASLKSFAVVDCPRLASLKLDASGLKSFWYKGFLPVIQIHGCSSLVDVVLDLREGLGGNEFDCEDILPFMASLKDIETLMISGWLLEWLCSAGVIFGRLQFQFNKLKELCWFDSSMSWSKRDSLACFLHISPLLEKLTIMIDQNLGTIARPCFFQYWHEPHLLVDHAAVKANASELGHLKIIKLAGFSTQDDELLLLMDLLLKMSTGILASMTVTTQDKQQSWGVSKIPKSQINHISGCPANRILIPCPDSDYFLGLTEESNSFCPATLGISRIDPCQGQL